MRVLKFQGLGYNVSRIHFFKLQLEFSRHLEIKV
jgi:hypothetical protein